MPKAEPHFDVAALLAEVHAQDYGLVVTTNNPSGFRRVVYVHARKHPNLRVTILADPRSATRLYLLRAEVATLLNSADALVDEALSPNRPAANGTQANA